MSYGDSFSFTEYQRLIDYYLKEQDFLRRLAEKYNIDFRIIDNLKDLVKRIEYKKISYYTINIKVI